MYNNFFDDNRQSAMRNYFLNDLSKLGIIKTYKKNELINIDLEGYVAIVVSGVVSQSIISSHGNEKLLYVLRTGEIFGEMPLLCSGTDSIIGRAKENACLSIVCRSTMEEELMKNPDIYRYFIHSVTRKFRIVLLQLTTKTFNDSIGRVADTLLRLSSCGGRDRDGLWGINMVYTHQELADIIGCSRITVTKCLNKFYDEGIITYKEKKIIIKNMESLKEYIDFIVEE